MSETLTRPRLYTYESYLQTFKKWVQTGTTSSANLSPVLAEFTKLNWARTQRLHKTISLEPALKTAAEKIEHSYH